MKPKRRLGALALEFIARAVVISCLLCYVVAIPALAVFGVGWWPRIIALLMLAALLAATDMLCRRG